MTIFDNSKPNTCRRWHKLRSCHKQDTLRRRSVTKREKKRHAEMLWKEEQRMKKLHCLEFALSDFNLLQAFHRLPAHQRASVLASMPELPKVRVDPAFSNHTKLISLKADIDEILSRPFGDKKIEGRVLLSAAVAQYPWSSYVCGSLD